MLLLTAATFSLCILVTDSCKDAITNLSKKLDFKTQGSTEFITLRPLVMPLLQLDATVQGLGL